MTIPFGSRTLPSAPMRAPCSCVSVFHPDGQRAVAAPAGSGRLLSLGLRRRRDRDRQAIERRAVRAEAHEPDQVGRGGEAGPRVVLPHDDGARAAHRRERVTLVAGLVGVDRLVDADLGADERAAVSAACTTSVRSFARTHAPPSTTPDNHASAATVPRPVTFTMRR